MNERFIVAGLLAAVAALAGAAYAGIASAMYYGPYYTMMGYYGTPDADSDFSQHYMDMLDIHEQYLNGEISYEQFLEMMNEEHEEAMPYGCGGYGMMGYRMMGM